MPLRLSWRIDQEKLPQAELLDDCYTLGTDWTDLDEKVLWSLNIRFKDPTGVCIGGERPPIDPLGVQVALQGLWSRFAPIPHQVS